MAAARHDSLVATNSPIIITSQPDSVVQSIVSLIADPEVVSLIPAWPITFTEMDFDREIFSTVILFRRIQEGLLSVTCESMCTEYWLNA